MGKAVLNRLRSVNAVDVNSHSLGVKITDPSDRSRKINHIMIPRNTAVPHKVTSRFVTNAPTSSGSTSACWKGTRAIRTPAPRSATSGSSAVPAEPSGRLAGRDLLRVRQERPDQACHARELKGNTEAQIEIVRDSRPLLRERRLLTNSSLTSTSWNNGQRLPEPAKALRTSSGGPFCFPPGRLRLEESGMSSTMAVATIRSPVGRA